MLGVLLLIAGMVVVAAGIAVSFHSFRPQRLWYPVVGSAPSACFRTMP